MGVCSTTFGDLVCRGCQRFAHEISAWNAFDEEQRTAVWDRLHGLRAAVVEASAVVRDESQLRAWARQRRLQGADELKAGALAYEALRRLASAREPLAEAGLAATMDTPALLSELDAEVYRRALAEYERSYRVSMADQ